MGASAPVPAPGAGAAPAHGYGGRTLAHKLGLTRRPDQRVLAVDPPEAYPALLADVWPLAAYTERRGRQAVRGSFDLVHLFAGDTAALTRHVPQVLPVLDEGAALWVSWPKKSSSAFVDLTEDGVRAAVLPTGWVDVKVAAVDATWSGLQFRRRRA